MCKNAQQTQGCRHFSTSSQNDTLILAARKLSKLIRRSILPLPGKGLQEVFSCQIFPGKKNLGRGSYGLSWSATQDHTATWSTQKTEQVPSQHEIEPRIITGRSLVTTPTELSWLQISNLTISNFLIKSFTLNTMHAARDPL